MKETTFKNRRILIKNIEDGKIIADTRIIRFDSLANSATISANSLAEHKNYNISAYIFAEECLYEFFGTIKGAMVNNEVEVFLGKSKLKEDRAKTRYPVAMEGNIDGVIVGGRLIHLRKFMHIQTINMSANGILMKADAGCFNIGDSFSLFLKTDERGIEVICEIVRIQNSCMLTEEYGCRIIEIRRENEIKQEKAK